MFTNNVKVDYNKYNNNRNTNFGRECIFASIDRN